MLIRDDYMMRIYWVGKFLWRLDVQSPPLPQVQSNGGSRGGKGDICSSSHIGGSSPSLKNGKIQPFFPLRNEFPPLMPPPLQKLLCHRYWSNHSPTSTQPHTNPSITYLYRGPHGQSAVRLLNIGLLWTYMGYYMSFHHFHIGVWILWYTLYPHSLRHKMLIWFI